MTSVVRAACGVGLVVVGGGATLLLLNDRTIVSSAQPRLRSVANHWNTGNGWHTFMNKTIATLQPGAPLKD
jgi:hypothetical protein